MTNGSSTGKTTPAPGRSYWTLAIDVLCHLGFILLAVSAIHFYEERLFGDSGAYIFDVINTGSFWVMNSRYILAVSQFLAVVAVWLHLPLKSVLIAYSLWHVVFFYLIFLAGRYRLKQSWAGPVVLALQTLGVNFTYFAWPFGEIPYGIGVVLLIVMMMTGLQRLKLLHLAVIAALVFLIITSHPFVVVLFGLTLALLFVRAEYRKKAVKTGALLAGMMLFKLVVFPDYMGALFGQRMDEGMTFGFDLHELRSMVRIHSILFYSLAVLAVCQLFRQRWFWFLFTVPAALLVLFIIKQYFPLDGATQQYYVTFTGIFLVTLAVDYFDREPLFRMRAVNELLLPLVLLALTGWSFAPIWQLAPEFTDRVDTIKMQLEQCRNEGHQRNIVNGYNFFKSDENIWMESEIRIESLLFGCQEDPPAFLMLFERASEQIEFLETNTAEFASPSTPGAKTKRYPVNSRTQAALAKKLEAYDFISNREYFPIGTGPYHFLNTVDTNSFEALQGFLEPAIIGVKHQGFNAVLLEMSIGSRANEKVYSCAQNDLVVCLRQVREPAGIDTLTAVFPLMADIDSVHRELVRLENMVHLPAPGDRFILEIRKRDRVAAASEPYIIE